jgi:hypothetical protein
MALAKVTFACDCPQAHLEASIQTASASGGAIRLLFGQSGKKSLQLGAGTYDLAYRAQGTPETAFALKVVTGAKMTPIDRLLPADGTAAGIRTLVVL